MQFKKMLTIIYCLCKKNVTNDTNYQINIQEEEQKFSSRANVLEKDILEKISPKQVKAKHGKHLVNYRMKFPLGITKVKKIAISIRILR